MILYTAETAVDLKWVATELALVDLSKLHPDEIVGVYNKSGTCLFVCTIRTLITVRSNEATACRICNNLAERRRLLEAAQLAAGGNPG
jgi:hypothetical protein